MLYRGRERILDVESDLDELIDSMTLHIHAVTTDRCFSKYKLREGEYQSVDLHTLDRSRIPQYCLWLAVASVEQVKQEARYPW
ncbi:hypothetical protein ACQPT2_06705 [Erwinia amylovora]